MSVFNDNNGAVISITGSYCTIVGTTVPVTIDLGSGGSCEVIEKISWHFISNASAAGSVALQILGGDGTTWRSITLSPFPITLATGTVYHGDIDLRCHGAQLLVTLSAGTLTYAELIGIVYNI